MIIGIDVGKKGGIALLSSTYTAVFEMPALFDFANMMRDWRQEVERVFIEKQQAYKGQGIVSTARLMRHYGELIGVLVALGISFEEVPPQRWKSLFSLE